MKPATTHQTSLLSILLIGILVATLAAHAAVEDIASLSITLVNQEPDPAIAGNLVEVRLGIQNNGGAPYENTIIEVLPQYPFSLAAGEPAVQRIGTIGGLQGSTEYDEAETMKIIKYRLILDKEVSQGTYELKIKHYKSGSNASTTHTVSLDVKNRQSAEVIHIDRTSILPGKESPLKFTITNVGNAPLRDLTFNWNNADGVILPVGSDNTKYIKYIDMDESADLEYRVIADTEAKPGLYKLDLKLTYEQQLNNGTNVKELSSLAGVYVGGQTDFDVSFSESTNGQTAFSVANIGSTPAYSVSVVIPNQPAWRVTGSNSVIIGNLNKGDYTIASFKLQSPISSNQTRSGGAGGRGGRSTENSSGSSSASGFGLEGSSRFNDTSNMPLMLQIAYTDTMGERQIVEKQLRISASNLGTGTGTTLSGARGTTAANTSFFTQYQYYIYGLVVLVIIGFLLRSHTHRQLAKSLAASADSPKKTAK